MVFERLGCSLYDYLKRHDYQPFPILSIRAFAWQLLTAIEFIHRLQLIHTDLKPENILLVESDCTTDEEGGSSPESSTSSYSSPPKKRTSTNGRILEGDRDRLTCQPPRSNAVKCTYR